MSDGADPSSVAIGAGVAGVVGLAIAFIRALFARNVGAAEKALESMQADIKSILQELRSMHDEQTRQRGEIVALGKDIAAVVKTAEAAHDRIDALISVPPDKRKR